jgi:hypothetical protein
MRDFLAAAGLEVQRAGDILLVVTPEPPSLPRARISLSDFGASCTNSLRGFVPRYFSIIDAPRGWTSNAPWSDAGNTTVFVFARAEPSRAGYFTTMLFAADADWCNGVNGPLRLWPRSVASGDVEP